MVNFVHGTAFGAHFASFEGFANLTPMYYSGGVSESNAGMGLGFCVLLVATWCAGFRRLPTVFPALPSFGRRLRRPMLIAPWLLLLIFMAKIGAIENARHLAPYYPFLCLLPFSGGIAAAAARHRLWQKTGLVTMAFAALLVITQAPRPLFPAQTWLGSLLRTHPGNRFIYDECFVYNADAPHNIAAQRDWVARHIPAAEKTIGFVPFPYGWDEPALWLAHSGIRVQWLSLRESPEALARQGIHYAYLINDGLWEERPMSFEQFFTNYHASVVASANLAFDNASNCPPNFIASLPTMFYVVHFDAPTILPKKDTPSPSP
jgi:hypothetical protein